MNNQIKIFLNITLISVLLGCALQAQPYYKGSSLNIQGTAKDPDGNLNKLEIETNKNNSDWTPLTTKNTTNTKQLTSNISSITFENAGDTIQFRQKATDTNNAESNWQISPIYTAENRKAQGSWKTLPNKNQLFTQIPLKIQAEATDFDGNLNQLKIEYQRDFGTWVSLYESPISTNNNTYKITTPDNITVSFNTPNEVIKFRYQITENNTLQDWVESNHFLNGSQIPTTEWIKLPVGKFNLTDPVIIQTKAQDLDGDLISYDLEIKRNTGDWTPLENITNTDTTTTFNNLPVSKNILGNEVPVYFLTQGEQIQFRTHATDASDNVSDWNYSPIFQQNNQTPTGVWSSLPTGNLYKNTIITASATATDLDNNLKEISITYRKKPAGNTVWGNWNTAKTQLTTNPLNTQTTSINLNSESISFSATGESIQFRFEATDNDGASTSWIESPTYTAVNPAPTGNWVTLPTAAISTNTDIIATATATDNNNNLTKLEVYYQKTINGTIGDWIEVNTQTNLSTNSLTTLPLAGIKIGNLTDAIEFKFRATDSENETTGWIYSGKFSSTSTLNNPPKTTAIRIQTQGNNYQNQTALSFFKIGAEQYVNIQSDQNDSDGNQTKHFFLAKTPTKGTFVSPQINFEGNAIDTTGWTIPSAPYGNINGDVIGDGSNSSITATFLPPSSNTENIISYIKTSGYDARNANTITGTGTPTETKIEVSSAPTIANTTYIPTNAIENYNSTLKIVANDTDSNLKHLLIKYRNTTNNTWKLITNTDNSKSDDNWGKTNTNWIALNLANKDKFIYTDSSETAKINTTITWIPDLGNGNYELTIYAIDSLGGSCNKTYTITVAPSPTLTLTIKNTKLNQTIIQNFTKGTTPTAIIENGTDYNITLESNLSGIFYLTKEINGQKITEQTTTEAKSATFSGANYNSGTTAQIINITGELQLGNNPRPLQTNQDGWVARTAQLDVRFQNIPPEITITPNTDQTINTGNKLTISSIATDANNTITQHQIVICDPQGNWSNLTPIQGINVTGNINLTPSTQYSSLSIDIQFTTEGDYLVQAKASDDNGATWTDSEQITVTVSKTGGPTPPVVIVEKGTPVIKIDDISVTYLETQNTTPNISTNANNKVTLQILNESPNDKTKTGMCKITDLMLGILKAGDAQIQANFAETPEWYGATVVFNVHVEQTPRNVEINTQPFILQNSPEENLLTKIQLTNGDINNSLVKLTHTGNALSITGTTVKYVTQGVATITCAITNDPNFKDTFISKKITVVDDSNDISINKSVTITAQPATITYSNLTLAYNGTAQRPTATTSPLGLPLVWENATNTEAGNYKNTKASIDNQLAPNYIGSNTTDYDITKINPNSSWNQITNLEYGMQLTTAQLSATFSNPINNERLAGSPIYLLGPDYTTNAELPLNTIGNTVIKCSFIPTGTIGNNFNKLDITQNINISKAKTNTVFTTPNTPSIKIPIDTNFTFEIKTTRTHDNLELNNNTISYEITTSNSNAICTIDTTDTVNKKINISKGNGGDTFTIKATYPGDTNHEPSTAYLTCIIPQPGKLEINEAMFELPIAVNGAYLYAINGTEYSTKTITIKNSGEVGITILGVNHNNNTQLDVVTVNNGNTTILKPIEQTAKLEVLPGETFELTLRFNPKIYGINNIPMDFEWECRSAKFKLPTDTTTFTGGGQFLSGGKKTFTVQGIGWMPRMATPPYGYVPTSFNERDLNTEWPSLKSSRKNDRITPPTTSQGTNIKAP
jgi:hypothetical protein